MHELGITDAMLKTVDRLILSEGMNGANSVTVEVGDLSGVVPRFLSECWEAVVAGTKYEQTGLIIQTLRGTARCEDCQAVFAIELDDLRCPNCHGSKLTPLTGRDVTITEIEAY